MAKKVATLTRTIVHEDNTKTYENFGVVFSSDIPGVYSLLEEVDTDEKQTVTKRDGTEIEVPVRSRIVARKAENGEKIVDSPRTDGARVFYNLTVWEDMDAKPRKQ